MLSNKDYQYLFHEIKNDISVIDGSLQLMEKQHPEICRIPDWENTMSDIAQLRSLLLDVSKYGICEHPHKEMVNLNNFLSNLRRSAQALLSENSSLVFDIQTELSEGFFDPARIRKALLNLIKNALEAAGDNAEIVLRCYHSQNSLFFEVSDNGPGMTEDVLHHLFEPFFTRKKNGNGLGLTLVKSVVEAHGGTITPHSVSGCGTSFLVELPAQPRTETAGRVSAKS